MPKTPRDHAGQKHSLWLVPPAPQRAALQQAIRTLCQTTGLPVFTPHITVLGDIAADADTLARALAPLVRQWSMRHLTTPPSLPLTLTRLDTGTTFFQSLYACVAPCAALTRLHEDCRALLTPRADTGHATAFTPHISLAYGPLPDTGSAIPALRSPTAPATIELPMTFAVDGVHIVRSSNDTPIEAWKTLHVLPFAEAA